jgi:hypothetical protein
MSTWRELIIQHMKEVGESPVDVVGSTLSEAELDVEFSCGYGGSEGKKFTLWTDRRVYFPVVYDGAEWVGSAPRNRCDEATQHQGGQ